MQQNKILLDGNIHKPLPGDHIFAIEFHNDEDGSQLKTFEYEIDELLDPNNKSHIENVELSKNPYLVKMHDIRFPKMTIKQDIKYGFFDSALAAGDAFLDMMTSIYDACLEGYKQFFNKEYKRPE